MKTPITLIQTHRPPLRSHLQPNTNMNRLQRTVFWTITLLLTFGAGRLYGAYQDAKLCAAAYQQALSEAQPKNDVEWVQREWKLSENDAKAWLYDSEYRSFRSAVPN